MATLTSAGAIPANPVDLLNAEIASATALAPGLTANLPGSLIEDLASTATGAVVVQDQAYVDLVNSISPYTANPFILYELGAVYGVQQGQGSNTSVYVTFSGSAGFVIPIGFVVSDGSHQYTVQDGGIINNTGQSSPLFCLAISSGSWAVPAGTVNTLITSVPSGITLTCTNINSGTAGASAQTIQSYQSQVIQAGLATAQGVPSFIKTALLNVSGVQPNIISVRNVETNQWEIICGGSGDPYQIANAIFNSIPDISSLVGSTVSSSRNITVTINNYPDTYNIVFVNPVVQNTGITLNWSSQATNVASNTAVVSLAQPAIVNYINSIYVGQPINLYQIERIFEEAVSSILPTNLISNIAVTVYIAGSAVSPITGTHLYLGDVEGYYNTTAGSSTTTSVIINKV